MPKQPKIPLVATAATKTVIESPLFMEVLEHWREVVGRTVVVIPKDVDPPKVGKVRWHQVNTDTPTFRQVVEQLVDNSDYVTNVAAIVDPFTVFRWDVFKMFDIAERRKLSLSWMATAHPVKLLDYDTENGIDDSLLTFFCAPSGIWDFMNKRFREEDVEVPFVTPAWCGWLATWSTRHVHTHKYHDITDLKAVGRLEDAPAETVGLEGLGPLTFNPPIRNYVSRIQR